MFTVVAGKFLLVLNATRYGTIIPAAMPPSRPPKMPPFVERTPETTPATIPTSSKPDTCFAATTATTTGNASIIISKTSLNTSRPGILLKAIVIARAIKAGSEVTIIP